MLQALQQASGVAAMVAVPCSWLKGCKPGCHLPRMSQGRFLIGGVAERRHLAFRPLSMPELMQHDYGELGTARDVADLSGQAPLHCPAAVLRCGQK